MHGTEYTAQIKALIAAKNKAEENMKQVLYTFRNGRTPNRAAVSDARDYWAEALAIVDPEDAELRRGLDDQLDKLRAEIISEDNSDYDELVAARTALNTALALLGIEGIK